MTSALKQIRISVKFITDQKVHFNFIDVLVCFMVPTCFGHLCDHLQCDFSENNNTIVIKMCI